MKKLVWTLYLTTAIYFLLDGYHTILLLKTDFIVELNPLLNYIITFTGTTYSIIWVKIVVLLLLFEGLLLYLRDK